MEKVDSRAVDLRRELRVRVESGLGGAPVVAGTPVLREVSQVVDRDAAFPTRLRGLGGPPGTSQPARQIVEVRLWNVDAEGCDLCRHAIRLTGIEDSFGPQYVRGSMP